MTTITVLRVVLKWKNRRYQNSLEMSENVRFLERILSMLSNPATPKEIQSRSYALVFKDSLLILSKGLALPMMRPGITRILFMDIHASYETQ